MVPLTNMATRRPLILPRFPSWKTLLRLNKESTKRFPDEIAGPGLQGIGLCLVSRPRNGGYWCTPRNSRAFAWTGGNGVHFSFLTRNNQIDENSPVIVTNPSPCDHNNVCCGENLLDFLCLGFRRGYFAMEQFGHDTDYPLKAFTSPSWQPTTDDDYWVGFGVNRHQRQLLDLLIDRFDLKPWKYSKQKFRRLQRDYVPMLDVPPTPWDQSEG